MILLPGSAFDPEAECSRVKGGGQCYNMGGYYSEARWIRGAGPGADEGQGSIDGEGGSVGRWVRTTEGRPSIRHGFPHTNAEMA